MRSQLQFKALLLAQISSSFMALPTLARHISTMPFVMRYAEMAGVVLCVASSGIASLLLLGGRTAHYRFKISLNPNEIATCNISKSSAAADLLRHTDLII